MTPLQSTLASRREEFDSHFALAKALEDRMVLDPDSSIGTVSLSARHINTVKSGLVVHLYNIEEAFMTQVLEYLGSALGSVDPRRWSDHSLREWLRETIVSRISEISEDGRLTTVFQSTTKLRSDLALGPQKLKKPSGTWDDKGIATFGRRMNVAFDMPPNIWQSIAASPEYGDKTPLQFLAERRNAIAHGRRSFEDGASDQSLVKIRKLADTTLGYLDCVAGAFHAHVENEAHLVAAA